MLYSTEAVVIRHQAYGETHAIITLLTPSGTVDCLARGAKKPQSRLAAGVQLGVRGWYTLSQGRGLGTVQQCEVLAARRTLRADLLRAAYAAYFCELVRAAAEPRPRGSAGVYRSFIGALDALERGDLDPAVVARIWESKVLRFLGACPEWSTCGRCGNVWHGKGWYVPALGSTVCESCLPVLAGEQGYGTRVALSPAVARVLQQFVQVPWERLGQVTLSAGTIKVLDHVLSTQLVEYAGLSLKSRNVLQSLLSSWTTE
ncbi:MAG: DNA repair protein RecO [Alicyclobacillus sp.]|nr:DNA repair protein RecO [Alicyclobacillus sp.]